MSLGKQGLTRPSVLIFEQIGSLALQIFSSTWLSALALQAYITTPGLSGGILGLPPPVNTPWPPPVLFGNQMTDENRRHLPQINSLLEGQAVARPMSG